VSDLVVAIDAGTQSIRAALVDLSGQIVALEKVTITPYVSPKQGWAEQDGQYYWDKLCEATNRVLAGVDPARLGAVSLSTQRQTVLPVDTDGIPLRPAIVWMDERRADAAKTGTGLLLGASRLSGAHDVLKFAIEYSRANWLRQHEPEIWDRTHKFLFLSGFFTHRLTGEFVESTANVFGPWPFDVRKTDWAGPKNLRSFAFGIERAKLPDLIEPGKPCGQITKTAAEQTGLPAGLAFISGASDKSCDLLGAGALEPDTGFISYGTTATFNVFTRKYVEIQPQLPPYPAAIGGAFHTEVQVMRGLWLVSWFTEEFGLRERELAADQHRTPEELLDELVASTSPGSAGLVTLPSWTPNPQADPAMRGAVIGFSDVHTRAHLYRSILEGLALAMREGAEVTTKKTKQDLTQVRASGGGSLSDVLMQITADVFDLPTYRAHTAETSAVGAAILAAAGVGLHDSIESAAAQMTRFGRVFEPDEPATKIYDRLRTEVYRKAPGQLLGLNRSLKSIFGQN